MDSVIDGFEEKEVIINTTHIIVKKVRKIKMNIISKNKKVLET